MRPSMHPHILPLRLKEYKVTVSLNSEMGKTCTTPFNVTNIKTVKPGARSTDNRDIEYTNFTSTLGIVHVGTFIS